MTGPRSLYDLSLPIEETEEERIARLNSEGSFRLDRAGTGWKSPMADVPPLPPDPAMALLERAKQGPASDNQWSQGWNSSVIGMQQALNSIPGVLEVGDDQNATQKLDEFRRIDAGETLPPGSARVNQPYLRGSPEVRAALRAKAQAEQDAARSAYGAREATNARLEEEMARHTPRVSRASEVWASGSLRDASDYVKGIAGGLFPSAGASIAGGLVAGPWGAAAVSGALGGGETLSQGMTRGREAYEKVIPWAIGSAPLHALAERLGIPARYFSPAAKKGAAGAIAGEAMAEGSQYAIGQAALTGALGDPFFTKENLVGLADATVGGAVGGGIAHTGFSAVGGHGGTQIPPLPTTQDKRAPTFQGYIKEPLPDLSEPQDKRVSPPLQAPSETMFQRAGARPDPSPEGFYSSLRKVFQHGPEEATAEQWAQHLAQSMNKPKPGEGIKAAELERSGILHFLESRKALGEPVAKSEIIDHLDSKAVKLDVVEQKEGSNNLPAYGYNPRNDEEGGTQTTPPGGIEGTYGETRISAPGMTGDAAPYKEPHSPGIADVIAHSRHDERFDKEGNRYFVAHEFQGTLHQEAQKLRIEEIKRLQKEEGLSKEEASKRVPREFGYEAPAKKQARDEAAAAYKAATDAWAAATVAWQVDPSKENDDRRRALHVAKQEARSRVGALAPPNGHRPVPDAPFKDWVPLVLKHALATAVNRGLTRFAWSTGDTQKERYSLSRKLSKLNYHVAPDGKYEIEAFPIGHDDRTPVTMTVHPVDLASAVGADIAGKIEAREGELVTGPGQHIESSQEYIDNLTHEQRERYDAAHARRKRSLTGEGLEMGGDGKSNIYDLRVPNELEKLGKKWGVKAKSVELPHEQPGGTRYDDETIGLHDDEDNARYHVSRAGGTSASASTYWVIRDNDSGGKIVDSFKTRAEADNALFAKYTEYTEHATYHYIDIPPEMAKAIREEGLPLYDRTGRAAEAAPEAVPLGHHLEGVYERSPEYVERRGEIETEAKNIIRQIAPDVDLKVVDKLIAEIDGRREEVNGAYYTPALEGNLLDHIVALSVNSPDWKATLNHEVVHFLRRAGYIKDAEWAVLEKRAAGKGLDKIELARMQDLRGRDLNATEQKELAGLENKANWIQRYDIEKLYPGRKDLWAEEAVAKAKEAFGRGELKPGSFAGRVFDRISQFFDAMGLRLEKLGLATPEQIFRRIDTGEIGGREAGRDVAGEMLSNRGPNERIGDVTGLGGVLDYLKGRSAPFKTGRDLKAALQQRALDAAEAEGIDLTAFTPETEKYLVDVGLRDAKHALKTNANAVGWYNKIVTRALDTVALLHPEIKTDPVAKTAFVWALAVTSNGMKVDKNFQLAEDAYSAFKKTGKMPTDIGIGTSADKINEGLDLYNRMIETYGQETVAKFMLTEFTSPQIERATGLKPTGEAADVPVLGAAILGPKIGNGFYGNLNGIFSQLTMDRWLVRTWGRWTGTLLDERPDMVKKKGDELKDAIRALSPDVKKGLEKALGRKLSLSDPEAVAAAINKFSQKPENREVLNAAPGGTALRKIGNALWKYSDAQKELPSGPVERKNIRKVMGQILEKLQADGHPDINMSDLQALLWYPEKRLYDTGTSNKDISAGYLDDEAPDYANAAAKLVRSRGIDVKEPENATDERAGAVRRGQRGAAIQADAQGGVREDGGRGFNEKEKRDFLSTGIIHRLRSDRGRDERQSGPYARASGGGGEGSRVLGAPAIAVYTPDKVFANAFAAVPAAAPKLYELEPAAGAPGFRRAIEDAKASHKFGAAVYVYPEADYAGMRLFLTKDGKAGFALKDDDIVSVFAGPEHKGGADAVMQLAVQEGGRRLDAFDTVLPHLYAKHGFKAVARVPWNEEYAPEGWDKNLFQAYGKGEPDVVYMVYDPAYFGRYEKRQGDIVEDPAAAAKKQREKKGG